MAWAMGRDRKDGGGANGLLGIMTTTTRHGMDTRRRWCTKICLLGKLCPENKPSFTSTARPYSCTAQLYQRNACWGVLKRCLTSARSLRCLRDSGGTRGTGLGRDCIRRTKSDFILKHHI